MSAAPVVIDACDAVEIAELLDFVVDLCNQIPGGLSPALCAFVGRRYRPDDLADDCRRLAQAIGVTKP